LSVLVTGAAGFIGSHVCDRLLGRGETVIGIDSINDYYDPALKQARLARLRNREGFFFRQVDIAEPERLASAISEYGEIDRIVHLAAQPGVRYSLVNPFAYAHSNLVGHLSMLELARRIGGLRHLVYASSSSVYGANAKLPFSTNDPVDRPVSLYAATKKSNELMSYSYSHLFGIPQTGLRFFTVYGPWGRPDMVPYVFARAIVAGEPIKVHNHGDMRRDFTFVDDIVTGVIAALDHPPAAGGGEPPHRVYNIGNHRPEPLLKVIDLIETALGRKAERIMLPMQPGEVLDTYADIEDIHRDLGFQPTTNIEDGIERFADWFKSYHGV